MWQRVYIFSGFHLVFTPSIALSYLGGMLPDGFGQYSRLT